jgi:ribosomal protein S24E
MKVLEILKDFDNKLLERREIIAVIDYEGGATPSKEEVREYFAKKYAVDKEKVEVSKIMSEKGIPRGKVWIKIWYNR